MIQHHLLCCKNTEPSGLPGRCDATPVKGLIFCHFEFSPCKLMQNSEDGALIKLE
ncbi:hypothetical protein ACFPIK_15410 [Algoriphagus aquatilis]|uniref:Uncharacterized protein n=1 Tax=Algoriphagus aquatilis TaxID=490186 RepID=A0ABW0C1V6_9BACT